MFDTFFPSCNATIDTAFPFYDLIAMTSLLRCDLMCLLGGKYLKYICCRTTVPPFLPPPPPKEIQFVQETFRQN